MLETNDGRINRQSVTLTKNSNIFELLNHSIPVLMGIFIFINPFPHLTAIKEICFYLSCLILLLLLVRRKADFSFSTPLTIPFIIFIGWTFAGLFFALDKGNSIHDFYSHLLRYIIIYYILINFFNSRKRFIILARLIMVSSVIFSIAGLFYFYIVLGNSLTTRFCSGDLVGLLGNKTPGNTLSVVIIVSILFFLNQFMAERSLYRKILVFVFLIPQFVFVALSQSRGAYIALCMSILMLLFKNKKVLLIVIATIIIAVIASPIKDRFTVNLVSQDIRVKVFFITWEIVKDYPVIGIGFGNETYGTKIDLKKYDNRLPEKYRQNVDIITAPHNIFLNVLVRLGFGGLALFLYILFVFLKMCWQCIIYGKDDFIKNWGLCMGSALCAFVVAGMFEQLFNHLPEVLLFTILSMGTIVWRLSRN